MAAQILRSHLKVDRQLKSKTMKGTIKGWNFLGKQKLSADGSTTNQTLQAEKKRLEARLVEIPTLIARLQNSITLTQNDITWLNGLNNRRRKDWEKENGKNIEQVVYDANNTIVNYKAQVEALNTEKSRIPAQIETIDKQLQALITGESTGLSKGLTVAHAQQLGQLELQKETAKIEHEQQVQQVELQKAQSEAQAAAVVAQQKTEGMNPQLKWGLIISTGLLILAITIYVIRKRKQAAALVAQTALS